MLDHANAGVGNLDHCRAILLLFSFSRIVSIYLSALWFGSLGYSSVYWYVFKTKVALFAGLTILTALLLSATFLLFQRLFGAYASKAHDHSQQSAVSVFAGEVHSTTRLGDRRTSSD